MAGLALVAVMVFAWVVPAQAIPFFGWFNGLQGTVADAGTTAKLSGITVDVYDNATNGWLGTTMTDANGFWSYGCAPGNYNVRLSDPRAVYGEQWDYNQPNQWDSSAISVASLTWSTVDMNLRAAVKITDVVRRYGHPLTRLAGIAVSEEQTATSGFQQRVGSGLSSSAGACTFAGLRGYQVLYKATAQDPKHWFGSASTAYAGYTGGTSRTVYVDMTLTNTSKDCTIGVPTCNPTVKHGVSLTVAVTAKRSIASSTKMTIVAKKGSTTRYFYLPKVSHPTSTSTKYSAKIKLPSAGSWKLYALWPGNSAYAPTDSVGGKSVTAK